MVDAALGLALAAVSIVIAANLEEALQTGELNIPDSLPGWLLVAGPAWAVPLRRVVPAAAVVLGALLQIVVWGLAYPDSYLAMAVLLYSGAAYGGLWGRRTGWAASGFLTAYTTLGVLVGDAPVYAIPIVGLFSVAATALGATTAGNQAYAEAAESRAEELERSRQADQDRVLVEERARIARELHDVVAHGLSVIVVQASAARRILDRDPEGTASALEQIEETGRTALNEMRQVLAAIRTEPSESWQPAPGLSALDDLIAELSATGLQVTVTQVDAGPGGTTDPLPATVDVTAYRIVQESLTNVLKHGGEGVSASVDIARRPGSLDLRIVDDGRGAAAAHSGGHGLRGMQERVEVFGGRFAAGPQVGGGFEVAVTLPVDGGDGGP